MFRGWGAGGVWVGEPCEARWSTLKHARLPIRAPATGEVCLGGGGQVGDRCATAHVVCLVCVWGGGGLVDLVCAFCVLGPQHSCLPRCACGMCGVCVWGGGTPNQARGQGPGRGSWVSGHRSSVGEAPMRAPATGEGWGALCDVCALATVRYADPL